MNFLAFILVSAIVLLLIIISLIAASSSSSSRDDSDPAEGRSGMAVRIDSLTGCEYLEGSRGGITPRLDRDGNHICRRERP